MHTNYPFLFVDVGTLFSHLIMKGQLHMHVIVCICVCKFWGRNSFKGGENVNPGKNPIFLKKRKIVIYHYSTG